MVCVKVRKIQKLPSFFCKGTGVTFSKKKADNSTNPLTAFELFSMLITGFDN